MYYHSPKAPAYAPSEVYRKTILQHLWLCCVSRRYADSPPWHAVCPTRASMKCCLLKTAVVVLLLLPWASAFSQGFWRARSEDYDEDYDDFWADDEYYNDEEGDSEAEEVTSEEISNSIEDDDEKETSGEDSQEDGDELSGEEDNSIEEESEEEDSNISVLVDRIGSRNN